MKSFTAGSIRVWFRVNISSVYTADEQSGTEKEERSTTNVVRASRGSQFRTSATPRRSQEVCNRHEDMARTQQFIPFFSHLLSIFHRVALFQRIQRAAPSTIEPVSLPRIPSSSTLKQYCPSVSTQCLAIFMPDVQRQPAKVDGERETADGDRHKRSQDKDTRRGEAKRGSLRYATIEASTTVTLTTEYYKCVWQTR